MSAAGSKSRSILARNLVRTAVIATTAKRPENRLDRATACAVALFAVACIDNRGINRLHFDTRQDSHRVRQSPNCHASHDVDTMTDKAYLYHIYKYKLVRLVFLRKYGRWEDAYGARGLESYMNWGLIIRRDEYSLPSISICRLKRAYRSLPCRRFFCPFSLAQRMQCRPTDQKGCA